MLLSLLSTISAAAFLTSFIELPARRKGGNRKIVYIHHLLKQYIMTKNCISGSLCYPHYSTHLLYAILFIFGGGGKL